MPSGTRETVCEALAAPYVLRLAEHVPAYVTPDMLSWTGAFLKVGMGISSIHALSYEWKLSVLVPASMLLLAWFCDSLDGPLARHRKIGGPGGFLLDHGLDLLTIPTWLVASQAAGVQHSSLQYFGWLLWVSAGTLNSLADNYRQSQDGLRSIQMDAMASLGLLDWTLLLIGILHLCSDPMMRNIAMIFCALYSWWRMAGTKGLVYAFIFVPAVVSSWVGYLGCLSGAVRVIHAINDYLRWTYGGDSSQKCVIPVDKTVACTLVPCVAAYCVLGRMSWAICACSVYLGTYALLYTQVTLVREVLEPVGATAHNITTAENGCGTRSPGASRIHVTIDRQSVEAAQLGAALER